MAEEKIDALIPRSHNALEKTNDGVSGILSTMVSDALALARKNSLTAARFRIGNHVLREPDYRQILLWAKSLDLDAEEVIRRLEDCTLETRRYQDGKRLDVKLTSRIENGSIVALAWDFDLLPLTVFEWVDGLIIQEAGFSGLNFCMSGWLTLPRLPLRLPWLTFLTCYEIELDELDLTNVPELIGLNVNRNQLAKLDLSHVPKLIWLDCDNNELTELDLSTVPRLTYLSCESNNLTKLDLSNVPDIIWLNVKSNRLAKLDLSFAPKLIRLECYDNKLTNLDLTGVPGLTYLSCGGNKLTKLDLSSVPGLTKLMCHTNLLAGLDLSDVPGLTFLACGINKLTELNLSNVPRLTEIWCSDNQITELELSNVPELIKLWIEGNKIMKLDINHLKYLTQFCCDLFVLVTTSPTQKLARDNGRRYRKFLLGSD
jgi:hypothetical protein